MRSAGNGLLIGILAVAALGAIIVGSIYFFGTIQKETAPFRGGVDATERIQADGSFRIAAYDEFFRLCSAVKTKESELINFQEELKTASPQQTEQLRSFITAAKNARASLINRYNARASSEYTVGQFRDSDLPFQLDINDKETTCAIA